MNYNKIEVSDRLKKARQYFGETQEQFAERLGTIRNRISKIEKGEFQSLMIDETTRLIENGISIDYIISGRGSMLIADNINRLEDASEAYVAQQKLIKCMEEKEGLLKMMIERKES